MRNNSNFINLTDLWNYLPDNFYIDATSKILLSYKDVRRRDIVHQVVGGGGGGRV